MKSHLALFTAILGLSIFSSERIFATAIFAGSYTTLSIDQTEKKVSINYPRSGKTGLCGIELKSNVIVLNTKVWRDLSSLLIVQEIHDDRTPQIAEPAITSEYSPRLRYIFSQLDADYSSFILRTKNGETLKAAVTSALGEKANDISLIAVGYTCE